MGALQYEANAIYKEVFGYKDFLIAEGLSTHPVNPPYQYTVLSHPIDTPHQLTVSTHPLNTSSHPTLSSHPLNKSNNPPF